MELGKTRRQELRDFPSVSAFHARSILSPYAVRVFPSCLRFPGKPQLSPVEPGDAGPGVVCCGAWDGDLGPLDPRHRAPLASTPRDWRWEHRARPVRSGRGGRHSRRAPRASRPGAASPGEHPGRRGGEGEAGGARSGGVDERESHAADPE